MEGSSKNEVLEEGDGSGGGWRPAAEEALAMLAVQKKREEGWKENREGERGKRRRGLLMLVVMLKSMAWRGLRAHHILMCALLLLSVIH